MIFICVISHSQTFSQTVYADAIYKQAYDSLDEMLAYKKEPSFKKAVFITENAFGGNHFAYSVFCKEIFNFVLFANKWVENNKILKYKYSDSLEVLKSYAAYAVLKDTVRIQVAKDTFYTIFPCAYNFDDYFGRKDWKNTFVTKLLDTNIGNCHSLPYLYKILADELKITNAWLSFAPYHIYIKNHCEGIGWFNTELTSGQFPVDAWIMASGYVPLDAIRSGIYMDTLSNKQAVANCVLDLAKGYERKYKIYTDSFIVRCCDLALKYHPNNINAIIYKAETLKKMYRIYQKENPVLAAAIYQEMEKLYVLAMDLGYKEMPEKMYKEWLLGVAEQKAKYANKKVINIKAK